MNVYRVNCYDATMPQTPFGGFKQSGQGRELYVIFVLFSKLKKIYNNFFNYLISGEKKACIII